MMPSDRGLVVLDTNVVSALYDVDSEAHEFYAPRLRDRRKVISFVTQYEVRWGVETSGWSDRRKQLVISDLEGYEVVWGDFVIVRYAVELMALCIQQRPSFQDLFIASTAYALGCLLATDDRRLVEQLSTGGFHNVISRYAV